MKLNSGLLKCDKSSVKFEQPGNQDQEDASAVNIRTMAIMKSKGLKQLLLTAPLPH